MHVWSYLTSIGEPKEIDLSDRSLQGKGVFETIRLQSIQKRWHVIAFEEHLERFLQSARALELFPINRSLILSEIKKRIAPPNDLETDKVMRLILLKDSFGICLAPWHPRFNCETGISLKTIEKERFLPEHKNCWASASIDAAKSAVDSGFNEGLLIDSQGIVREGAWSNFFWISSAAVFTTKKEVLPGITRSLVMNQLKGTVIEQDISLDELVKSVDSAFITHSTHGIVPVKVLNEKMLLENPLVSSLQRWYKTLLKPLEL